MRGAAIPVVAGIALTSGIAWTQGAEDPAAQLRDCIPMERTERLECLDKVSPTIAAHQGASKEDNWIISQTTSPVDYSPVATATTLSNDGAAAESAMKLSIRCRGGRTELVVAGPGISGRGADYAISYRVNDGQQVQIAAARQRGRRPGQGSRSGATLFACCSPFQTLEASASTLPPAQEPRWMERFRWAGGKRRARR